MTKPVCCLLFALSVAACVPPKATIVEEAPAVNQRKEGRKPAPTPTQEGPAPLVIQESGMRIPEDRLLKLPDKKDMTATAPAAPGGGVIATPPTADKRGDE